MVDVRKVLLDWTNSGGFAATHGAGAGDEEIVEDLVKWLEGNHLTIVQTKLGRALEAYFGVAKTPGGNFEDAILAAVNAGGQE